MTFFKRGAHKYNATKVETDGHSFSSKLELAVYQQLKYRKMAGEITDIQVQDHVYLTDARILYIPDFKCTLPSGGFLHVEAKGFATPEWRIKRRLWIHYGPNDLEVWMGTPTRLTLSEVIKPKGAT